MNCPGLERVRHESPGDIVKVVQRTRRADDELDRQPVAARPWRRWKPPSARRNTVEHALQFRLNGASGHTARSHGLTTMSRNPSSSRKCVRSEPLDLDSVLPQRVANLARR